MEQKKSFKQKFKEKTRNAWEDRENFVVHTGKYTYLEKDLTMNDGTAEEDSSDSKESKEEKKTGQRFCFKT